MNLLVELKYCEHICKRAAIKMVNKILLFLKHKNDFKSSSRMDFMKMVKDVKD